MDKDFRLATAREALKRYDEWVANPSLRVNPGMVADLASAARWLVEMLDSGDVTVGEC